MSARKIRAILFVTLIVFVGRGETWAAPKVKSSKKTTKVKEGDRTVLYPKETYMDFEGLELRGTLNHPSDFYFQVRKPEKFDSLVKRRPDFHREMLRDVVMSR